MSLSLLKLCSLGTLALAIVLGFGSSAADAQSPAKREFAPGVMTTIAPDFEPEEAVSTHDLVEIRANPAAKWQPELTTESRTLHGMSQAAKFRRDVTCLEFAFKPLRMIRVDVLGPDGKAERKLVWYLVYSVRNTGETLHPIEQADGVFSTKLEQKGGPLRFVPSFVLEAHDLTADGQPIDKSYLDQVIPAAMSAIRARETRGQSLLNSAEMAQQALEPSDGRTDNRVWGVATWTDVDPRIDFFSVFVSGLSNAYQWEDPAGAYQPGNPPGTGRTFKRKTLQLNFWRPGDEHIQDEREVRFGVARGKGDLYDVSEGVAYVWVYR